MLGFKEVINDDVPVRSNAGVFTTHPSRWNACVFMINIPLDGMLVS